MSLIHHVSNVEGFDREREDDLEASSLLLTRTISHKISYDMFSIHSHNQEFGIPPSEGVEFVAAYEVSTLKRAAQVIVGCIMCIFASGITFGFAALKSVLVNQKVYREYCTPREIENGATICYLQDQRLNFIFIVASVTTNVGALIVGTVLDRYGPRICGFISSGLLVMGCLCMAFADILPFDAFVAGSFLLAFGGTFVFVPSFHLSNAFPKYQGLVLALITGAFDVSAVIFLGFKLAYEATDGRFGLRTFFLIYLVVPIFVVVSQILLMPDRSYSTRTELQVQIEIAEDPTNDLHDSDDDIETEAELWKTRADRSIQRKESIAEIRSILGTQEQIETFEKKEEEKKTVSGVWGALHGLPASAQIQTPWFVLITLLTVLQMARFNFFISTIWTQYEYMLQSKKLASQVNEFFDYALPLGGALTVPFIGFLLDNVSTVGVLALIVLMSTVVGALGAIPTVWAAYTNVCLFVILRPLYYSAMSDYAAKVFGFATFGTVYGTIVCFAGFGIFCQSALQALVHSAFEEDPGPMNLWLAGIGLIIGVCLLMYVDMSGRMVRREQAREDGRNSLRTGSRRPSKSSLLTGERRPLLSRDLSTVQERPEPQSDASSEASVL